MNYEYPPIGGGGGAVSASIAGNLVRLGHRVDVVTSTIGDMPAEETAAGVFIHRVPCWRRYAHYATLPEMGTQVHSSYRRATELLRERPSIAVNHTHFILPTGLASYRLWKRQGLPYVVTIHGSDVPGYNPDRFKLSHLILLPFWKRIVEEAASLNAPSHFLKQLVEQRIQGVNVEIVPNALEFPELTGLPKRNRILVVTRMFPRKGVQFVLEAMDAVGPDWELHLAGDGPYLSELKQMAAGLARPVHFHGFVRGRELWDLYESAKIFVFPSTHENYPIVLLEAMSAGCAVITSKGTGSEEVVGDAAIKVPPRNVDALRQALRTLINDEDTRQELSRLGRKRAAAHRPEEITKMHERILRRHARQQD